MRLVEILARELHEWPDGQLWASQDPDKEVRFDEDPIHDFYVSQLADDAGLRFGGGARVTRETWEAERAKLASTAEWDGDGLPPVGTDCEVEVDEQEWFECTVAGHYEGRAVIVLADKETTGIASPDHLRSIRTPEQVAAENREKGIMEMMHASGDRLSFRKICEALYDAGYRKQEKDQWATTIS